MNVLGLDLGFRNTGIAAIEMREDGDFIIAAHTVVSVEDQLQYAALRDVSSVMSMFHQVSAYVTKYKAKAIFAEIPHGGGQSSRALICMSCSSAMLGILADVHDVAYEFMIPTESDRLLEINIRQGEAAGMKSSARQKWKKERLKMLALRNFPSFEGWPPRASEAEHAFDAACAFVAGRKKGDLYNRLRAKLCK